MSSEFRLPYSSQLTDLSRMVLWEEDPIQPTMFLSTGLSVLQALQIATTRLRTSVLGNNCASLIPLRTLARPTAFHKTSLLRSLVATLLLLWHQAARQMVPAWSAHHQRLAVLNLKRSGERFSSKQLFHIQPGLINPSVTLVSQPTWTTLPRSLLSTGLMVQTRLLLLVTGSRSLQMLP